MNFKGSIDRVDRVNGIHRVIDYKTGTGATDFKEIGQLFDASKNNRPHQILQLFVYGLFYLMENPAAAVSPQFITFGPFTKISILLYGTTGILLKIFQSFARVSGAI